MEILQDTLRTMPEAAIKWWITENECHANSDLVCARHPLLENAIRSINGLNLLTATSNDPEIENTTYNRWLYGHYTSCVMVFSPCGVIPEVCLTWHRNRRLHRLFPRRLTNLVGILVTMVEVITLYLYVPMTLYPPPPPPSLAEDVDESTDDTVDSKGDSDMKTHLQSVVDKAIDSM